MIDPLLRGIYYMYLSDEPPEFIDDVVATFELAKIWQGAIKRGNWTCPLCLMHDDRELFVEELVRRNG